MRKVLKFSVALLMVACGSSKKVVPVKRRAPVNVKTHKEVKVVPTKEVVKEVKKVVQETKKEAKKNLNSTTLLYVEKYAPLAMDEMRKFKIPASITLAQGILESGSGKSQLSAKSNNHFGIKCHKGWKGGRVYHDDDAKGECFRKYKYPATSYQDHSLFLSTRFRYASLFKLRKDDYKGWARGLKKAGYATDPKYPNKLISFIEKYELYRYDKLVLKGKVDLGKMTQNTEERESVNQVTVPVVKRRSADKKGIYVVKGDDTLYAIATKYCISVDELKRLNGMSDNTIHEGDELNIVNRAKRKAYHVVQKKETLYSISRKYGISIDGLKKRNRLRTNDLSIGQELRIK